MKNFADISEIKEDRYFIFKHSSTCPISGMAHDSVAAVESKVNLPIYKVVVQQSRELSKKIETHFGVLHESPQLLLVELGKVLWHASHYNITPDAIQKVATQE